MKFGECYEELEGKRPVISFEVFPPRTEAAEATFDRAVPALIKLQPDLMTVTYGAMGSTRDRTLEIARKLKQEQGVETACHLTCVGSTAEEIAAILDEIAAGSVENLVALRGDPPEGEKEFHAVEGGYSHAVDLVRHVRERGGFGVAVAGYPEKHIEAPDLDTDLEHLKTKVDAGADVVVTQLFYDNSAFFRFVDRARAIGISCPIVAGILPVLSRKQILRITQMCGASIPDDLRAGLEAAGDDNKAAQAVGVGHAVRQVTELLDRGVAGIHFYVLNRSSHIRRILEHVPARLLGR